MSQGQIFKASCIELGTPYEARSYLHYQAKIQIWEWEREIYFWEENDWWNLIYKPMLGILPLLDITLSVRVSLFLLFFSLSIVFAVCVLAFFFLYLPSFFFFSPFVCTPSIYGEIPKKLFPYFSLNWSDHGAVFVSFSFTTPNFLLNRCPLFSFSGLLSPNRVPYFLVVPLPCSLYSLFFFNLICVYLLLLDYAAGYERGSYYYHTSFFFFFFLFCSIG